jgi:hypothetical protein
MTSIARVHGDDRWSFQQQTNKAVSADARAPDAPARPAAVVHRLHGHAMRNDEEQR